MKGPRFRLLPSIALLAQASIALPSSAQLPSIDTAARPTLAPLARRVTPAVVNIAVTSTTPRNPLFDDPVWRRFFGIPEGEDAPAPERQSAGSGVIVDAERGYILTNHHVIAEAQHITVNLVDHRDLSATLVGSDEASDIALLKVDARGLTALEIGDSETLAIGDFVLAVGNPFGLGQTVTLGIVSALGRSGLGIEGYEDFIQTDAAINPGNSGGALVDVDGKLVGISSAIVSGSGGNIGIGFAVPSNMARAVMEQLIEYGDIRRGRLGIMVQEVTPDLARALALPVDRGAVVTDVEPGSAAERAGIVVGDIIVAVAGRPIGDATTLRNRVGLTRAGETLPVTLLRDGNERTIDVAVGATPTSAPRASGARESETLEGATLGELDRADPRYGRVQGAVVTRVAPATAAARAGLVADDVIVAVNRMPVRSIAELTAALNASQRPVALQVQRGTTRLFVVLR